LLLENKSYCKERNTYEFQAQYANLNESECITSILYFWELWLQTRMYEGSICNVVEKHFSYQWMKQVKPPFEKRYTAGHYKINFHKLRVLFWHPDIMKQSEVYVCKHTYEYLPYNYWTNTRLAKDVMCNTICYMTTNDSVRNAQLKCFKLITHI
jgi:hypothetical protein